MFGNQYVDKILKRYRLSANDWLATATELTATTIVDAISPLISRPAQLIIAGGGSDNPILLKKIKDKLSSVSVIRQESLGFNSDSKEAIAMTILANQTYHHRPSNVPSATGAKKSVILGSITYYD